MKKMIFRIAFIFALFIAFFCNSANAYINSESDIQYKINQIYSLCQTDFFQFINKSELIGYRLSNFEMQSQQYKNTANATAQRLNGIITQINLVKNSSDFTDSEKTMQINKLYQDAETILIDLNNSTVNYIFNVRMPLPSISYQRYSKKFIDYYNSFHFTDSQLSVH